MSHRRLVSSALPVGALLASLLPAAAGAQLAPVGPTVTIDGNKASVTWRRAASPSTSPSPSSRWWA